MIGSGPYLIKEWKPNDHLTLEVNPDYKGNAPAPYQRIVLKPIPEWQTALLAFQAKEVAFTEIEPTVVGEVEKDPDSAVIRIDGIDKGKPINPQSMELTLGFENKTCRFFPRATAAVVAGQMPLQDGEMASRSSGTSSDSVLRIHSMSSPLSVIAGSIAWRTRSSSQSGRSHRIGTGTAPSFHAAKVASANCGEFRSPIPRRSA